MFLFEGIDMCNSDVQYIFCLEIDEMTIVIKNLHT